MSRPTTLPEPWRALAAKLVAVALYQAIQDRCQVSEAIAKRICRNTGTLNFPQCQAIASRS